MKKLLAAAALLPTLASAASLLDSTVNVHYHLVNGPDTVNTLDKVVVGAGTELSCASSADLCRALTAPMQSLDFSANDIRYDYAGSGADFLDVTHNWFQFTSLYGADTAISGVQLTTNIAGLDASRISFGAHMVRVDMHDLHVDTGAFFQLGLQTVSPVPEPASAALLLGGLTLIGLRRRR
ncbi:MAG TPA: PEP-CTERM sorting domain-containing protein [Roseateles sp.]